VLATYSSEAQTIFFLYS